MNFEQEDTKMSINNDIVKAYFRAFVDNNLARTQQDFADLIGYNKSFVSEVLKPKREPSKKMLEKVREVAKANKIKIDEEAVASGSEARHEFEEFKSEYYKFKRLLAELNSLAPGLDKKFEYYRKRIEEIEEE